MVSFLCALSSPLPRPSASVMDPLHFGTDPDLRISFFAYYVLLKGTFASVFKNKTQKEVIKTLDPELDPDPH